MCLRIPDLVDIIHGQTDAPTCRIPLIVLLCNMTLRQQMQPRCTFYFLLYIFCFVVCFFIAGSPVISRIEQNGGGFGAYLCVKKWTLAKFVQRSFKSGGDLTDFFWIWFEWSQLPYFLVPTSLLVKGVQHTEGRTTALVLRGGSSGRLRFERESSSWRGVRTLLHHTIIPPLQKKKS